jgi:hypothetical protein
LNQRKRSPSTAQPARRSSRVSFGTRIVISGTDSQDISFRTDGEIINVSFHGARIRTNFPLIPEMQVRILLSSRMRSCMARVVWVHGSAPNEFGIELESPENFWGMAFPPDDWKEVELSQTPKTNQAPPPTPHQEKPVVPISPLETLQQLCGKTECTIEAICRELARIFRVRHDEVAVLKLNSKLLRFVFPPHLCGAGSIPISSSAVAAKTASKRTSMISNEFMGVQHMSAFEVIPYGDASSPDANQPQPIQKLMSVAVVDGKGSVLGVIQIGRKGPSPKSAGPNFTGDDLKLLEAASPIVAVAIRRLD